MPSYKYIVANQQGKKLSGTVEAPSLEIARSELNNLGFSIFNLEETREQPKVQSDLKKFDFEALDSQSKFIQGSIPAANIASARQKLEKQYNVTVTAIWPDGASESEIETARLEGSKQLRSSSLEITPQTTDAEELQKQVIVKEILEEAQKILNKYHNEFSPATVSEVNKKLNKLLRIKNSNNFEYIKASAEELIAFLQAQEEDLTTQGFAEKRFQLAMETKKMLSTLNKGENKSFSEDVVQKIENWQHAHILGRDEVPQTKRFFNLILEKIKSWFKEPEEIRTFKEQIKAYNHQIWEFRKIYYREPVREYKMRALRSLETIKQARDKAKRSLKQLKLIRKAQLEKSAKNGEISALFSDEILALSGWLLAFYVIFYIVGLYLNTKNFGLASIPHQFDIYDTRIFKHVLILTFLLHSCMALKKHIFPTQKSATALFSFLFVSLGTFSLFNF